MNLNNSFADIKLEDINQLELLINITFPDEYRKFLLQNNGGETKFQDYKINGEYFGDVAYFLGIRKYPSSGDLRTLFEEHREVILSGFLPIAVSHGGDLICISCSNNNCGDICHWDHETANWGGAPNMDNMQQLATSTNHFMEMLYDAGAT